MTRRTGRREKAFLGRRGLRRELDGYPPRHHEVVRASRRNALISVGITGSLACAAWLLAMLKDGWLLFGAVAGAVFLFVLFIAAVSWWTLPRDASIHPYFERHVGGTGTFGEGHALARQFMHLDALAAGLGVIPPSSYGFADDLAGEEVVWHDAEDGARTFEAVLEAMERDPGCLPEAAAVKADVERVAAALRRARDQGIRFSLLLRHSAVTSGQEWDVRKGTAF